MTLLALAVGAGRGGRRSRSTSGIAGARLGNSRADVRKALGKPSKARPGRNDFGRWVCYRFRGQDHGLLPGARAWSPRSRPRGSAIGRRVGHRGRLDRGDSRSLVKGLTCEDIGANVRTCHTGEFLAGRRVTDFRLSNGNVESVTVAFVID